MMSAGIKLAPCKYNIGHRDNFTFVNRYPDYRTFFFAAHTTHRKHLRSSTAKEREGEAAMTDDGPQPPQKQLQKLEQYTMDLRHA